jgi:hypothetical protein
MRPLAYLALAAAVLLMTASPSWACHCGVMAPVVRIDASNTIFLGTVKSVSEVSPDGRQTASFDVHAIWKGKIGSTAVVSYPAKGQDCGWSFFPNQSFVVFAWDVQGVMATSSCLMDMGDERGKARMDDYLRRLKPRAPFDQVDMKAGAVH